MTDKPPHIAVIGAGGVGGYFGARLAAAGVPVSFVARGAHLRAMRASGLRIESPLGGLTLTPVRAFADAAEVGEVDLVIIAVKLWDTQAAVAAAGAMLGPDTALLSFQNGVAAVPALVRSYGAERVLGGVAHIAASIARPGVVRHAGQMARLTVGELDGSASERVRRFVAACQGAGFDAAASTRIRSELWEKFVFLAGLSGMTALTRLPIGAVREDADTRAMLLGVMREVERVGRAEGVELAPASAETQLAFCDGLPSGMIASMLGDLLHGRRLELEWLAGEVVRLARGHGFEAPLNQCVYAALKLHAGGAREDAPKTAG